MTATAYSSAPLPPDAKRAPRGRSCSRGIGNTPLLPLDALVRRSSHKQNLLGKAEWYNPGGSVKDRAAARIVAEARRAGQLAPGKILLDSTSGNTGIAYAMLGAALGFPVTLCVPENVSPERKRILQAYGANIIYTDPAEGSDGAIKIARQLAAHHPDLYFYADQYSNDANWRAHYETTANEIWQQTEGRITHFVAMLGTTGTFIGTTRRLKELNPTHSLRLAATRLRVPRYRGREAFAVGNRAAHLRRVACRREPGDLHRRCARHGPPPGARTGTCLLGFLPPPRSSAALRSSRG